MLQCLDCAVADSPSVMLSERCREVFGGAPNSRGHLPALRQLSCDRCRKGAPRPVDVGHGEARTGENDRLAPDPGMIGDLVSFIEMPAFDEKIAAVAFGELARRGGESGSPVDFCSEQDLGFGQVRGDESGEGKEARLHLLKPPPIQQPRAGSGANDRIDHERDSAIGFEKIDHDFDEVAVRQHSRFCGSKGKKSFDFLKLMMQKRRIQRENCGHCTRCLRDHGSERIDAVDAVGGESLEVGLDSGTG